MPTRYLRAGIRDSETINLLSSSAECFFYRLLVTVDDFGRYDARPSMLKAQCYPVKDSVSSSDCKTFLDELESVGLVQVYSVGGKPYLQLMKWENLPRAKASKFPDPQSSVGESATNEDERAHLHTDVCNQHTSLPLTVTETENREPEPKSAARAPEPATDPPQQKPEPPTRHGAVAIRLREQGVRIQPADPHLCDWVNDGVTDAELDQAVAKARRTKNETEPIAAAYLNPIVREVIAGRNRKPQRAQRPQSESRSRFAEKYGHVIPDAAG